MQKILQQLIVGFLLFSSYLICGEEDIKMIVTSDGKKFFNVKVLKKNPTSLDISYYKTPDADFISVTTIPFSKMTKKYQKKYGYNGSMENSIELKDKTTHLSKNETNTRDKLKESILQFGKPMIVKSGCVYNLDGSISRQSDEVYKNVVFLGCNKHIIDNDNIYICDNPVDAKDYLKDLSREINELKEELKPRFREISETESQIRLLNDRLTELQKLQATRTYQSSSLGTVTVSYSQTEVNKCLKDLEDNKAKLETLNNQPEIVSLTSKINSKETQYKNYSMSLAKLERISSSSAYNAYFDAIVIVKTGNGFGSGFFITKTGYLITNEHVVGDSKKVRLELLDKPSLVAYVVEVNKEKDLALLKTEGSNFPCLEVEDTNEVQTGDDVIAIGTPKGLSWTVTKGIISAVREEHGISVIQTDVAINPGNSGGPLINVKTGKVVGVNREIVRQSKEGLVLEGLNFAIAAIEISKAFPNLNVR